MWHYTSDGSRHGPVSEQDVAAMIADGRIRPTSYVREEGADEWREARQTSLARYFSDGSLKTANAEDARRLRDARRGGGGNIVGALIGFGFVAIVLGGGYWISQGGFTRAVEGTPVERYVPAPLLSDEAVARRMEADLEQRPIFRETRTLPRFKALFPEEYHGLIRSLVPLYRRNASEAEAEQATEQRMHEFLERSKPALIRASPESLSTFLAAEATMFQAMRRSNVAMCAMAVDGGGTAAEFGRSLQATNRAELDALNVSMLEAIRNGQTANNVYAPMTPEDFTALGRALLASGVKPEVLRQFSENPRLLSAEDKCGVLVEMVTIMSREPDINLRARYAANIGRNM